MKYLAVMGLGCLLGPFLIFNTSKSVTFQSLESITAGGLPVYNEIKFLPSWDKDVWMMRQSHHGYGGNQNLWDRLAIVVDKASGVAQFYQLTSGTLNIEGLSKNLSETQPLKARCFACHSNGPRAVRMNLDSQQVHPSLFQRAQVTLWNLRIKTYGRVQSMEGLHFADGAQFKSKILALSKPLTLTSCTKCHGASGIRNSLSYEQVGTANFMVKGGFMPPFPFSVSDEDRNTLANLTSGH